MSGSGDFNIVGSSQVLAAEATLKMNVISCKYSLFSSQKRII